MIWLALGLMTAMAAALLFVPLLRRPGQIEPRTAYDREIYRDQLAEIERDAGRGLIGEAEATAARTEIARRMIAAADRPETPLARRGSGRIVAALAIAAPATALALYLALGAPQLGGGSSAPPTDMASLVGQLAARMQEKPGDQRGWALLGRSLRSLERYVEAAEALGRAAVLAPDDAALHAEYGEVLALAADGRITPPAQQAFQIALAADPKEPRARYYLGLADAQDGNMRAALARWIALEADSAPDAPWRALLGERIKEFAAEAGIAPEEIARMRGPGPGAAEIEAARSMLPEDRAAMIRGMVERLAERLEREPGDADGWVRLARSYAVLGETAKARDALSRALKLRPDDAQAKALAGELEQREKN